MPCLVHEVGVTGDAKNLAAEFLELAVLLLKVRKLRRADKREIRRIEEEHAPLAPQIRLCVLYELTVRCARLFLEGIYLKIADFLVDE